MKKEIVIKETAREKGSKAYGDAIKKAKSSKTDSFTTKAGIFVKRAANKIILF